MLAALAGCQQAKIATRCRGNGVAQNARDVLGCRSGRWVKLMSKADALRLLAEQQRRDAAAATPITVAPSWPAPPAPGPVHTIPRPTPSYPIPPAMPPDLRDATFGENGFAVLAGSSPLQEILPGPGGSIYLVFTPDVGGVAVARLTPDGAMDQAFSGDGWLEDSNASAVTVDSNARVVTFRSVETTETINHFPPANPDVVITRSLTRYDAAGQRDQTFGTAGVLTWRIVLDPNWPTIRCPVDLFAAGDAVIVETEPYGNLCPASGVDSVSAAGQLRRDVASGRIASDAAPWQPARAMPGQNGSVLVMFTRTGSAPNALVARLGADGTVDPSFVPRAITSHPNLDAMADMADGSLILSGPSGPTREDVWLVRYLPDGGADRSGAFAPYGQVTVFSGERLRVANDRLVIPIRGGSPIGPSLQTIRSDGTTDLGQLQTWSTPSPGVTNVMTQSIGARVIAAGRSRDGTTWVTRLLSL